MKMETCKIENGVNYIVFLSNREVTLLSAYNYREVRSYFEVEKFEMFVVLKQSYWKYHSTIRCRDLAPIPHSSASHSPKSGKEDFYAKTHSLPHFVEFLELKKKHILYESLRTLMHHFLSIRYSC